MEDKEQLLEPRGRRRHAMNIISVLVFVFIVIPILYWSIRLAWWLGLLTSACSF
jgi:hypothetical protein